MNLSLYTHTKQLYVHLNDHALLKIFITIDHDPNHRTVQCCVKKNGLFIVLMEYHISTSLQVSNRQKFLKVYLIKKDKKPNSLLFSFKKFYQPFKCTLKCYNFNPWKGRLLIKNRVYTPTVISYKQLFPNLSYPWRWNWISTFGYCWSTLNLLIEIKQVLFSPFYNARYRQLSLGLDSF